MVKVSQTPPNRYAYYLTPKGFSEKSRLTARYLKRSFEWERGVEAYLPRYHKRRRHARRTEWIAAPLFPRYLFVRADLACIGRRLIGAAPGVVNIVSMGREPAALADAVIEDIRAREDEGGLIDLERGRALRPGEEANRQGTGARRG